MENFINLNNINQQDLDTVNAYKLDTLEEVQEFVEVQSKHSGNRSLFEMVMMYETTVDVLKLIGNQTELPIIEQQLAKLYKCKKILQEQHS